jgi:hypothetical protein
MSASSAAINSLSLFVTVASPTLNKSEQFDGRKMLANVGEPVKIPGTYSLYTNVNDSCDVAPGNRGGRTCDSRVPPVAHPYQRNAQRRGVDSENEASIHDIYGAACCRRVKKRQDRRRRATSAVGWQVATAINQPNRAPRLLGERLRKLCQHVSL